jgi:hypothetical protein
VTASAPEFTLDELLAQLQVEQETFTGYRTAGEWCDALSVSMTRLKRLLRLAQQQSRLAVRHERRLSVDGLMRQVPVYRFEIGAGDSR